MRGQGTGWRGPDAAEMDDAEGGCHARGILTACGSGAGSDFQCRPEAESLKGPAWGLIGQALSGLVEGSDAEGVVRKGAAGRAIEPERC